MSSEILTLSGDAVLCEYVPLPAIKGFVTERVSVGPDHLALLIRDGKVAHVSHGANISVGGVWQGIKSSIGGRHALRLLIADLKPFPANAAFTALTRDDVRVAGEVTLELQLDPEKPANVLALASDHDVVTKAGIVARLAPHIGDRALQAAVRDVDALALRGDARVQDVVQARIMEEAERVFGDMGLLVRAVSVNWAFNEEEIAAMERRKEAREQDMLDAKLQNLEREIRRSAAVTTLQISTEADIETLRATSDHDLRQLVLNQEIESVDTKETAARVQRMKALEGEIEEIKREQEAKFDLALGEAQSEIDIKRIKVEAHKLDLQLERLTREQQVELTHLEEMNRLAIAREAHALHRDTLTDLQTIELAGRAGNVDIDNEAPTASTPAPWSGSGFEWRPRWPACSSSATSRRTSSSPSRPACRRTSRRCSPSAPRRTRVQRGEDGADGAPGQSGAQTGEQAKFFFEQFKEGVVGVAAGAGGASSRDATVPRCSARSAAPRTPPTPRSASAAPRRCEHDRRAPGTAGRDRADGVDRHTASAATRPR